MKPARLYARKASEALETIKVSFTAKLQLDTGFDIVFQAMPVLQAAPLNTLNRPTRG